MRRSEEYNSVRIPLIRKRLKREENSLVKNFYLTPKDVDYRLALEGANYVHSKIPLSDWYPSFLRVKSTRDNHFFLSSIILIMLSLSNFRAIEEVKFSGIGISNAFVMPLLFMVYSISYLMYSYFQSKLKRFEDIFLSIFDKSSQSDRFDMLLRYPDAFSALHFNPFIVGNLKHMFPERDYPIAFILLSLFILIMMIPMSFFILWIITISTINIYNLSFDGWDWFGICSITVSWSALICATLLTRVNIRRKYLHYGLVNLLHSMNEDDTRYKNSIRRINTARR